MFAVRPPLQVEIFAAQPPEVGVWQGTAVPMPLLQLPGQTEDARRTPHRTHAPREIGPFGTGG